MKINFFQTCFKYYYSCEKNVLIRLNLITLCNLTIGTLSWLIKQIHLRAIQIKLNKKIFYFEKYKV